MYGLKEESVHSLKGLAIAALILLFSCTLSFAQKPAGNYNITLWLLPEPDNDELPQPGNKLYLYKANWNDINGSLVDSAVVDKNWKAKFSGMVFALDTRKDQNNVFTAGQYYVRNHKGVIFGFLYSKMEGGYFKENFICLGYPYGRWQRKNYKPKKLKDLDIYYMTPEHLNWNPSLQQPRDLDDNWRHALSYLMFAEKEFPNSLVTMMLKFRNKPLSANDPGQLPEIADERLYYTSFGKQYIDIFLDKFKLSNERVRNMAIDYIMENRYLTDPKMKAAMAMECFRRYSSSILMGCEGGAVYAAEKYILGNKDIPEKDRAQAAYFVTLNKGTLIGAKAPGLNLKDTAGVVRSIREMMGAYSIIYFYSDDCNYCKEETPRLMEFIDRYDYGPLNIMTVYTGTNPTAWKDYVKEHFTTVNPLVNWYHVADIERESRFPVDYGVASTPKMFLLDESLRIRGRGILTPTLSRILENEEDNSKKAYEYLSTIFSPSPGTPDEELAKTWKNLADKIFQGSNSSEENYRRLMRQTFMYLYFNENQTVPTKETAAYLGQKYILDMPQRWEDTVFVESVRSAVRSVNLNRPGSKAENILLYDIAENPCELLPDDGKYKVLFFYRSDCGVCRQVVNDVKDAWKKYGSKVDFIGIYAGENVSSWRKFIIDNNLEFRQLYDKDHLAGLERYYYVESVPQILLVNPDNTIRIKDFMEVTECRLEDQLKLIFPDKTKKK